MDKTDQSELEIEELLRDPDRDAFWESLDNDPDKRRRYNRGCLNIVNANSGRTKDKKYRQELEELTRPLRIDPSRSPQGYAC